MAQNTDRPVSSRLKSFKPDSTAHAIARKMVAPPDMARREYKGPSAPGNNLIKSTADRTTQSINDATNIFQLLPDTELAMRILVSSILSPKDMVNVELNYSVPTRVMNSQVSGPMITAVREYFEQQFQIKKMLPTLLEDALFKRGSYPVMVLPESVIDDVINSDQRTSLEAMGSELNAQKQPKSSIGILGGRHQRDEAFSLESYQTGPSKVRESETVIKYGNSRLNRAFGGSVQVTDNHNLAKFPKLIDRMRKERIGDVMSAGQMGFENKPGMEDNQGNRRRRKDKESDKEFAKEIYPKRSYHRRPYVTLKAPGEIGESTRGHPTVLKLPPESVIPVHVPSSPSEHIGYYILTDQSGYFLNRVEESDYYRQFEQNLEKADVGSQLAQTVEKLHNRRSGISSRPGQGEAINLYADIVEQDLIARLKNGVYGEGVEIARPMNVYKVMMARALAQKQTQVLYVPAEMVTYFAFDYMDNGVGKSLIEDNKVIASQRAVLMFANTLSAVQNSTGRTSVEITLDEKDAQPQQTVEEMMDLFMQNRTTGFPLGTQSPAGIVNYLKHANVDVSVSNHPAYPQTRMETTENTPNKARVDQDLMDEVKSQYFMGFSMSPETIDQTRDVEFATSIVTSNLLFAKQVGIYQDILNPLLLQFHQMYIYNSQPLWDKLAEIVEANKDSLSDANKDMSVAEIVSLFVDNLDIGLPKPNTAKLETQAQQYRNYTDFLNDAVDAYLGEDGFMIEAFNDVESDVKAIRAAVIAHFQREWLRDNNILSELEHLTTLGDDDNPMLDMAEIQGQHMNVIGKTIAELAKKVGDKADEREKLMGTLNNDDQGQGGIGQSGSGDTGDDTGGDDDGGGFGGFNF